MSGDEKCPECGAAFRATHISSSGVARSTYECGRDGPNAPDTVPCLRRQLAAVQSLVDAVRNAATARKAVRVDLAEHSAVRPPIRACYPNVDVDMQAWNAKHRALQKRASKAERDFAAAVDAIIGDGPLSPEKTTDANTEPR